MSEIFEKDLIAIGVLTSPSGLLGEVKIVLYERDFLNLKKIKKVFIGKDNKNITEMLILGAKISGSRPVIKLDKITSREEVINYKNNFIFVLKSERIKLSKDKFFVDDLIGFEILDFETNKKFGVLLNIEKYPAQDVYLINTSTGIVMLPAVKGIVKEVKLGERKIYVSAPEGIFENEN